MDRVMDQYCRLLGAAMVGCLGLMVVLVFGNVVMRYGFNSGLTISEELARWLFVWMTFMGAIIALRERGHLGTDFLVGRLSATGKKLCLVMAHLVMLAMCVLLLRGAWVQAVINAGSTSAVMEVPVAWLYASGVVFAVSGVLLLLHNLWRLVTGQLDESELVGIRESEEQPH
ncbi:MAG: TRAP transporter small permease [Betaproteobacteria bacterium]|nr:TRAP transporter small permease [Betaproteobacteria bacterium]NBS46061.1 TRAP transporter small permease [Betaproteobacteria bacterium]